MSCESSLEVREGLLEFIPLEEAEESSVPGHPRVRRVLVSPA